MSGSIKSRSIYPTNKIIMSLSYSYNKDPMDKNFFGRTCESILCESAEGSISFAVTAFRQYLTLEEELHIRQQFHNT